MVNVETIDLSSRGLVLPQDNIGMVIAQPHIDLTPTEPFTCTSVDMAKEAITRTLEVSLAANHGASKTHFTIFPEYSIPGIAGIKQIEVVLNSEKWPLGTVVIGGVDALTKLEFETLAKQPATYLDEIHNSLDRIQSDDWVNCAVTWVKSADGLLERWLQPKLHPSWPEMNISHQTMFVGRSVYMFNGLRENLTPFRFASVVCFDWIAQIDNKKTCQWLLEHLHNEATPNQLPLSWMFVLQSNKKPSHDTFLKEVETFFDQTQFPNALRDKACLVFANQAGRSTPGRSTEFGGTSIVLSPRAGFMDAKCAPTFANGGPRFRDGSTLLTAYGDIFFRERGACIHSFSQLNPQSLLAPPVGKSLAIENAHVHSFNKHIDARTPSSTVGASVKWINDELDDFPSLSTRYPSLKLAAELGQAHITNTKALRQMPAAAATTSVQMATQNSKAKNADDWAEKEIEAIEHLLDTLDIIRVGEFDPIVGETPPHATIIINGEPIDLLTIRGDSHEACAEHSKKHVRFPRRRSLLISRDKDNNSCLDTFGSMLEPIKCDFSSEVKFTDSGNDTVQLGYRTLLDIIQKANTSGEVQETINAELV